MADYQKELLAKKTIKLRELIAELPPFCNTFFIAMESKTTILTRVNYAYDLRLFFEFLIHECPAFSGKTMETFTPSDLEKVTVDDLYYFLDYLNLYKDRENKIKENAERGKARKIACLRSFFKHYYKKQIIKNNICTLLDTPKLHEKTIVRLEPNEVADLLDTIESGEGLSEKQKQYHKKSALRDVAIFTLFLTTGIRVSELISINISDVDFASNAFRVVRKGGNASILYFGNETRAALSNYLQQRKSAVDFDVSSPLFISMRGSRLTVRAVENIVKKYTQTAVPLKKISPHKLRSTFGTMLYNETEDIYMVADVLGHKDVNTTRKHYATISDDIKRRASKAVKLRE
jgi:site-specific recombinase XerD